MRALLDTHTFLWAISGDSRLSARAHDILGALGNEILLSAVSAWEISTKHRLGKLPEAESLVGSIRRIANQAGFHELSITIEHAQRAGGLPGSHRDPFDRMLIAQAQAEDLAIVSNEGLFDQYGIRRLW